MQTWYLGGNKSERETSKAALVVQEHLLTEDFPDSHRQLHSSFDTQWKKRCMCKFFAYIKSMKHSSTNQRVHLHKEQVHLR